MNKYAVAAESILTMGETDIQTNSQGLSHHVIFS